MSDIRQRALDFLGEWADTLQKCPQDPFWHAEGDVLTHTLMVCESLENLDSWKRRTDEEREILFLAAVLHDIAKPKTTKEENGRITSKGHSRIGAVTARQVMLEKGIPFHLMENVCSLIARHQIPFHAIKSEKPEFEVIKASASCSIELLCDLAMADNLGRRTEPSHIRDETFDNVELFSLLSKELSCFDTPPQGNPFSVFRHIESQGNYPHDMDFFDEKIIVHLTMGVPASGKSSWANGTGLPVISQDKMRENMGLRFGKNEGAVSHAVREQARELLRTKQEFVWDATHLTRQAREKHIGIIRDYGAFPVIHFFECSEKDAISRNKQRGGTVPDSTIKEMFHKLDFPARHEAVQIFINSANGTISEWRKVTELSPKRRFVP